MFGAGEFKRFPFVFIFPGFAQVPEHAPASLASALNPPRRPCRINIA